MNATFAKEKGFKMEKLKKLLLVRNVDGTINVGRAITHQVECNMFFKGHMERARMDICNLGKTELILGMPWLAVHNPEIDWEKGEVKMTCCPLICGREKQKEDRKETRRIEKDEDEETLRKLVPKKFWKWKKVFGKRVREDASTKNLEPRHRTKEGVYAKKGEGILTIKRRKRGGTDICGRPAEERVHPTL